MSIFTVGELAHAIDEHGGDDEPVRWSDDPQGGPAAARHLSVELCTLNGELTVLICPSPSTTIETVGDFARELDEHGDNLPVRWSDTPDCAAAVVEDLTVELETFDGQPTVVIFPA